MKFLLGTVFAVLLSSPIPADSAWKEDWDKILQAAKKEGQVTVNTDHFYAFDRVYEAFRADHPEIKVVSVSGPGNQLATRIMAEGRAGKYLADVFSGGVSTNFNIFHRAGVLDPIRPALILPEVVDESKWYEGRQAYSDLEGQYIFAYMARNYSAQLHYNSKLLNASEFQSFWDLLNPKWKGKILSLDPALPEVWGPLRLFYHHPGMGPGYLKKLFGMEIRLSRDERQLTNWLAQGNFAICLACKGAPLAKSQGVPVDSFDTSGWKEGGAITASPGTLGLFNRAPHPNAARVFINWLLSRKGQIAVQKLGEPNEPPNSRRIDILKDGLPPHSRLVEGKKYFDVSQPGVSDMKPILQVIRESGS